MRGVHKTKEGGNPLKTSTCVALATIRHRLQRRGGTVATSTTASSDRIEDRKGDVTYIRTDEALPPVAIIDRSPITLRHKIIFGVIALVGAVAWAVIAFFRGETVSAVWFVIAAICTYVVAFRFYARLVEMKIVQPRDDNATPAEI